MSGIIVTGFVVGLLPLRIRRSTGVCKRPGRTLYAHPEHGMPDGRDFMALLLCSHVAVKGSEEVVARDFVASASLLRVATLRIEFDEAGSRHLIRVAQSWQDGRVRLSPEFVERCTRSPCRKLPCRKLRGQPPGVIATAMAMVTMATKSIGLSRLMDWLGSGTASRSSRKQQLGRWLRTLRDLGIGHWFYDASSDVIFEMARRAIEWVGRRFEPWIGEPVGDNRSSQGDRHDVRSGHRDRGNSS